MLTRPVVLGAISVILAACGNVAAVAPDASDPRDVKCGAQPIEVLPNGSFDASTPPWVQEPVSPALLCGASVLTPFDPPQAGCLGGMDGKVATLSQTVSLPAGAKTAALSGQICITTKETAQVDHDILQFDLLDGNTVIAAIGKSTNQQGVSACQFAPFEFTAAVTSDPVTATLRIRSTLDTNLTTTFFIDALSLKVGCTP